MRNEKGFTLIEILVVMALVAVGGGIIAPKLIESQQSSVEMQVSSDREILRTKASLYYLETGEHAIRPTDLTELMDKDTVGFVNWLSTISGIADEIELSERFKWLSTLRLLETKHIDSVPSDDRYVLDTLTYTLYHVTDGAETRDLLYSSSRVGSDSLDSMRVRRFPLSIGNKHMEVVNSALSAGNMLYVGGKGDLKLVRVVITSTTQTVEDLTHLLTNPTEVHGVSLTSKGLRVEYSNTASQIKIMEIDF